MRLFTGLSWTAGTTATLTNPLHLMALQFIAIICVKMVTSRSFRAKSDVFNKFLHSLQNLNLGFPYEDWDDGRYSLEEFKERHRSVTKEMAASFALTFVFSLISMCPVWYTGKQI